MRVRSTLAGFLVVMLLSISCAASACTISCDLQASLPTCHQHHPSAQSEAMAADQTMGGHCEHMGTPHSQVPHDEDTRSVSDGSQCIHQLCSHQVATLKTPSKVFEAPYPLVAISPIVFSEPVARFSKLIVRYRLPEPPPLLNAVLRI